MVDITKCNNEDCELKDTCYRFTGVDSGRQSYADFEPENGKCDYIIYNREGDNEQGK